MLEYLVGKDAQLYIGLAFATQPINLTCLLQSVAEVRDQPFDKPSLIRGEVDHHWMDTNKSRMNLDSRDKMEWGSSSNISQTQLKIWKSHEPLRSRTHMSRQKTDDSFKIIALKSTRG